MMKKPDSRSLTSCWAPKPNAAPSTVAGATSPFTEIFKISVICTATPMAMSTTDTQEITEATACRCLVASERTSASLSVKPTSIRSVTFWAAQVTNRAASTAPISSIMM